MVIVTNDNPSTSSYTLRVNGLNANAIRAVILNPPQGVQQLAISANPSVP